MTKISMFETFRTLKHSSLEFVSDFDIRISDLKVSGLVLVLFIGLLVLLSSSPTYAATSILNPSFEDGIPSRCRWNGDNVIDYWRGARDWGLMWFCHSNQNVTNGGEMSAAMWGLFWGKGNWNNRSDALEVTAGESKTYTAHVATWTWWGISARVQVWARGSSPSQDTLIAQSPEINNTNGWQEVTVNYTVPDGVSEVYFQHELTFLGIGFGYWDTVLAQPSPTPTATPTPTPTPTPTTAPSPTPTGTQKAWWQVENATVIANNEIDSNAPPPGGNDNSGFEIISGEFIDETTSSKDWLVENYSYPAVFAPANQLGGVLERYDELKASAIEVDPSDNLPDINGIYIIKDNYELDGQAQASWKNSSVSAFYIIQGDLTITHQYDLKDDNHSIFLVEGDVLVDGNASQADGFFIAEGVFDSDYNNKETKKQLVMEGGVVALNGLNLKRDLGNVGYPVNDNAPAEKFVFPLSYLVDSDLAKIYAGSEYEIDWQEVAP